MGWQLLDHTGLIWRFVPRSLWLVRRRGRGLRADRPRAIIFGGDRPPSRLPSELLGWQVDYYFSTKDTGAGPARRVANAIRGGAVSRVYIRTRWTAHSDQALIVGAAKGTEVEIKYMGPRRAGVVGEAPQPTLKSDTGEFLEAGTMSDRAVAELYVDSVTEMRVKLYRYRNNIGAFKPAQHRKLYPELGTMPDKDIAEKYGTHPANIGKIRRRRGIPRYTLPQDEFPEAGTMADTAVAELHDVAVWRVRQFRQKKNIPPFRKVPKPADYELAGEATDREAAELHGTSPSQIARVRRRKGLAPFRKPAKYNFPEAGILSDHLVAQIHNVTVHAVRHHRERENIPPAPKQPEYPEAGTMTDTAVAKLYGVHPGTIKRFRKIRGIPRFLVSYPEAGQMSDADVAEMYGVGPDAVLRYRTKAGIPLYRKIIYPEAGTMPDSDVARMYNVAPGTILGYRRLRNIPAWERYPEVGKVQDWVLAAHYGAANSTIGQYRNHRGIPPSKASFPEIGTMSDEDVGALYELPANMIRLIRERKGIPEFK